MLKHTRASAATLIGLGFLNAASAGVIINEIHYNPPDRFDEQGLDVEFLELYNSGSEVVSLGGAYFEGFELEFAPGTFLASGEYAIVAPDTQAALSV